MSRSGYSDDCEHLELYRAAVYRAINGRRGQAFLRELAAALDAMPEKKLISSELVSEAGEVCAIGAVCKARGLDVSGVDVYEPDQVGNLVGISRSMAAEIEFENDDHMSFYRRGEETPEERWVRMRKWVGDNIREVSP